MPPNLDNSDASAQEADKASAAPGDPTASFGDEIPPLIQRAQEAFHRDLPQLLENKRLADQWVAYHGDRRLGFGRSKRQLYQEWLGRGLGEHELLVRRIAPDVPREIDFLNDV